MDFGYIKSLDNTARERYLSKLKIVGINECPYNLPADIWQNNPTKWPEIQWPDVYHYLIDTPGVYTRESMKNFKSLEAHNFFISGWVQTVFHMNVPNTSNFLFKADVKPSYRVNDDPHHPWVSISKDGSVLAAHCDCMAGLGESCSHVAAVLFKIEAAVRNGYTKLACTDKPCSWNQCFTKAVQPAEVRHISFYKESVKEKLRCSKRKRKPPPPAPSLEKQKQFLQKLAGLKEKPVVLSVFKETAHMFYEKRQKTFDSLPLSLKSLYKEENSKKSKPELKTLCESVRLSLAVSEKENEYLKQSTKLQSDSVVWHDQRTGRVTVSVAHSVLHTNQENPAKSLIKKVCHPCPKPLLVPATMWGKENEQNAMDQYTEAISLQHGDVTVSKTGLGLLLDKPYIGATPDGLVSCSCCGSGVIEIKCPFSNKDSTADEIVASGKYFNEDYQVKADSIYYPQVQLQMKVFDRQFCHFVVWTTQTCIISQVLRDEDFIENMLSSIDLFWNDHCLPELLTHSMLKESLVVETVPTNDVTLYCYCQLPWDENDGTDMVGCDGKHCPYKWVHLACAKIKRVRKGQPWYCRKCKKNK